MNPIVLALLVLGGIFGLILLWKAAWAILDTTLSLSDFVVSALNFALNVLTLVAVVAGPVLVVILLGVLIVFGIKMLLGQIDAATMKLVDLLSSIRARIQGPSSQLLPLSIAGATQALLLALSKDFTPGDTKAVMSIFLWVGTTLLLMATSSEGRSRWIGLCGVALSAVFTVGFLIVRYDVTSMTQIWEFFAATFSRDRGLSATDLLALGLILALLVLFFATAGVQAVLNAQSANKRLQGTPASGRP